MSAETNVQSRPAVVSAWVSVIGLCRYVRYSFQPIQGARAAADSARS